MEQGQTKTSVADAVTLAEALYKAYAADVYNFLVYFTWDRLAAEDVLQETFLRVLKSGGTYAGRAAHKTWLFQIAKNAAIDWQRKAKRETAECRDLSRLPAAAKGLDDMVLDKEKRLLLHEAIRRLKPDYRLVVLLRVIEGFPVAETGQILGWSESKVKTTYHRALKQLARHLEEKGVGKNGRLF